MKFCSNCGNQLPDDAAFCGKCSHPVGGQIPNAHPGQMPTGSATSVPMQGFSFTNNLASVSTEDVLRIAQGVIAILAMLLSMFAPVIEGKNSGVTIGMNMATIVTYLGPVIGSVASALDQSVNLGLGLGGSSSSDLNRLATAKDALGGLNIWITVISILALVALVGTFMTGARTLEKTNKGTLVTGWLFTPYAIGILIITGRISSGIVQMNSLSGSNPLGSFASTTAGVGATFWQWIILLLGIVCGVLGVLRFLFKRGSRMSYPANQGFAPNQAYPPNQPYPNQPPIQY